VQVSADRIRGQLQPLRDLLSAYSLGQEQQDIPLTRGERREQVIAFATVVLILNEQVQHHAQFPGRQPGLAAGNAADDAKKVID
jgi:hypothetical protein